MLVSKLDLLSSSNPFKTYKLIFLLIKFVIYTTKITRTYSKWFFFSTNQSLQSRTALFLPFRRHQLLSEVCGMSSLWSTTKDNLLSIRVFQIKIIIPPLVVWLKWNFVNFVIFSEKTNIANFVRNIHNSKIILK